MTPAAVMAVASGVGIAVTLHAFAVAAFAPRNLVMSRQQGRWWHALYIAAVLLTATLLAGFGAYALLQPLPFAFVMAGAVATVAGLGVIPTLQAIAERNSR